LNKRSALLLWPAKEKQEAVIAEMTPLCSFTLQLSSLTTILSSHFGCFFFSKAPHACNEQTVAPRLSTTGKITGYTIPFTGRYVKTFSEFRRTE
jgi:hypothetical protein